MSSTPTRRVRLPGGEIAFVDAGDVAGPAVLLLHGHLTSSFLWRALVPLLSPWMRVLAPDLPGHGDSDLAERADLSVAGLTRTVAELLDELGVERLAAVGHGNGGAIAQRLAVDDRLEAFVLIDAAALEAPTPAWAIAARPWLGSAEAATVRETVRGVIELGASRPERLSEPDLAEYLRPFSGPDGVRRFVRVVSAIEGSGVEDLERGLEGLEVPALVLWGEEDAVYDPAMAERLGDLLPWASVALLPGCGHLLLEDAPETVAPLVFQWLRSRYLKVEHRHETGPVTVYLGRRPPGEGGDA